MEDMIVDQTIPTETAPAPEGDTLLTNPGESAPSADDTTLLLEPEAVPDTPVQDETIPEAYDIKAVDGYEVTPELMDSLSPLLKELKIPQAGAQKLADLHMSVMQQQASEASAARKQVISGWTESIKKDPEFGGARFNENMGLARRGLQAVMPKDAGAAKELTELLNGSGMGNHPEIIKAFARVGKMVKEDSALSGTAGGTVSDDPVELMFAKSLGRDKDF